MAAASPPPPPATAATSPPMDPDAAPPPGPTAAGDAAPQLPLAAACWSAVLRRKPAPPAEPSVPSRVFGSCGSSKGVSVAVVDANALIHGDKLTGGADRFVTVREVLDEVRDPASRHRLTVLPLTVETVEPSPDAIKKVVKFARETGDLQTLSDVDLKLIALTYMLEGQIHGTSHLRESPPPLHVVNVKNLQESDMPGWGSNVPNLAEWEALEKVEESGLDQESRILPLKDLDDNILPVTTVGNRSEEQENGHRFMGKPRRSFPPKKEIKLEGKKMVADGIDASQGEDTDNVDDWQPAVSRSTHRRYLRRKARREMSKTSEENIQQSRNSSMPDNVVEGDDISNCMSDSDDTPTHEKSQCKLCDNVKSIEAGTEECDNSDVLNDMQTHPYYSVSLEEDGGHDILAAYMESYNISTVEGDVGNLNADGEDDEVHICTRELDNLEISSQADGSVDTSLVDDVSSEQSWALRSLSDSSVACVTSDYAMQNVILQIGLRLLAPGGMQIRQLHRWVLKCHACNMVTQDIGRIFCPKCGNGGTLRKLSVTVGENGIVLAARRQRFILRGTKFSLPLPQGGRDAITKNPILREDQLPRKLLYAKSKKKSAKQDNDFLGSDDIFSNTSDKRAPLKPPVRKAMAMFSGKRNPNDNHFSRRKH